MKEEARYPGNDLSYNEVKVKEITKHSDGSWSILRSDGWSFFVPPDSPIEPEVGMVARFYEEGTRVRGLFLDGVGVFYKTKAEQAVEDEKWRAEYKIECERRALEPKNPDPQIQGFEWTDDMREISGFGSGYERACRTMVSQGCKWWSEHPETNPQIETFDRIFGVATPKNNDAKSLESAMMKGVEDCTGAMHQGALQHIFNWKRLGSWSVYQKRMRELKTEELSQVKP